MLTDFHLHTHASDGDLDPRALLVRARRELALVHERFGAAALDESEVFVPGREALMRAHLILPLLRGGVFSTYREGQSWFHANARSGVVVPRPDFPRALELIHGAGGWAVLAHPACYWKDGFALLGRLAQLREMGLDGVELEYPYSTASPELFPDAEAARFTAALRETAEELGLRATRGSDAHSLADFDRVYGPVAA